MRTAEDATLAKYHEHLRMTHLETPIVIGGDFNAELGSQELIRLAQTDAVDFHEILGSPAEDRLTYIHFDQADTPRPETIDHLLISPQLRERVEQAKFFVYCNKGLYWIVIERPASLQKRSLMPSDHYPQVLSLRL